MEQSRFVLLIAFLLGISAAGYAQQLSFTNPSGLAVCDSAFFEVQVTNDSTALLEGAQLEVILPACLEALSPSVFFLPPIGPSQTQVYSFGIFASCDCYDEVNAGAIFANEIQLLAWDDTLSLSANPYPLETAQLVITQVSNTVLSGSKGQMLSRSFAVQNTRPGPLTSFLFEDFHQPGIQLSAPQGSVEADQPGYFALRLDGMDFQSLGDGDALFEQGETLTLTENILITSCGFDNPSSLSSISFSWGCEGSTCQSVQQTALVQFEVSDLEASLEIVPQIAAPVCFCADEGVRQGLQIVNTGDDGAFGLSFSIRQQSEGTALDPSSAIGMLNGNPVVLGIQGTQSVAFEPPCQEGGLLWEKLVIACPDLQPGDTLLLQWDAFFCNPACAQSGNRWVYEYEFEKSCPPDQFVDSDTFQVSVNNPTLSAQLSGDFQLEGGETTTYTYSIQYDSLALIQGQLALSLSLPCGLVWENNPMLLNGVAPQVLNLETQDSALLVTALYPLPLPESTASLSFDLSFYCDSLCQPGFACADSLLTSCPQPDCSEEPGPVLQIDIQSTLLTCEGLPADCGLQSCDVATIAISCLPDSICVDTIAGYVWFGMDFQRISLGAPDNDDDRWPDGPDFLDPSLLRLDRSMPGDTVQTVLSGVVISDEPNGEFGFSAAWISFLPVGADPAINPDLFAPEGITALQTVLDIWDADAGLSYSCPGISTTPETASDRLIYHYAINPSDLLSVGCPLPGDFRWEDGDSIKLTALHRLDANPVKQSSTAPLPPVFPVAVRSLLSIGQTEAETAADPFVCGCDFASWEITGYEYELLPGLFAIPFCDTSNFQGASLFNLELGKGNFFPYEYRPMASVPDFYMEIPAEISLAEAQVKQFTLQGGPSWQGLASLPGAESNGIWAFDLAPFQNPPADEGFYFFLQYRFTADCEAEGAYPLGLEALLQFAPGISDDVLVEAEENALKPLNPALHLFNPLPNQLALDNKARWDFTLSNVPNSVSGQQSGTAPFIWLAPFSASGLLSDFTLTDTQSGQSLPFSNGIFQIGELAPNQSLSLQLSALNGSCLEEPVEVRYGFGCDLLLSPDQDPCQSEVQYWTVLAPPGGLDFSVSLPMDTCALLCDTVPYHMIELYNTNLGPVCNPWVEAILPQGLSITPGSSGLSYPSGSPFMSLGDPLDMGNGVFRWELESGSPELAANCLSGLGAPPWHKANVRFWSETDCTFPINSSILFRAGGERNCGEPVNTVTRPGKPICIQTEGSGVESFFQAGLEEAIGCQDTAQFNLALVHTAVTNFGDTLSLLLPPGVSFVPGSLAPLANAPNGTPHLDTLNGRIELNWALPPGLNPFTLMAFQFQLGGFSGLPCGEEYFWLSAGIQSQAVCAATGDTCTIRVETGTEYLPFQIERPVLTIESFGLIWQPGDILQGTIVVANGTGIPAENVVVDIYLDNDGDGQGDSLLLSPLIPFISGLDSLSFTIPATLAQACDLLAVIDSTGQCLCSYDTYPVDQPIEYFEALEVFGCSGEEVELAQCFPGWAAQWMPGGNLSCDSCCSSFFQAFNSGYDIQQYSLELALQDGQGCILVVPFQVSVYPEPGIAYADPSMCAGEALNLIAEPGIAFAWTGPGIDTVQQQGITVYPGSDGLYVLQMTDLNGCYGVDSTMVDVFALPVADAGMDTIFCPGEVFQLQAFEGPGYQYAWSPASVFLNANLPKPLFFNPLEGEYVLEIMDGNGCLSQDTIQVGFGQAPVLMVPADTTICAGDSLLLVVSGDFSTLDWTPPGLVQCLNTPLCDSILIQPQTSLAILITAINSDQCSVEDSLFVTVADEAVFALDTLFTCANEPVWIGDLWTAEAGLYCDTLVLASGCLQIHCTELMVGDTTVQFFQESICPGDSLALGGQWFFQPGLYPVSLSNLQGCDSLMLLDLSWWDLPAYSLLPTDTTIFEGHSVSLIVLGPGLSYQWSPSEWLDCDTCAQALASPPESGVFTVWISDEHGCLQSLRSEITVRVDCDPGRVQIPNAFTPDGDGVNDTFGILTVAGKEKVLGMQIWSRWGQLVFDSRDTQARWDGTFLGKAAPSDVYVYRIRVVCPHDGTEEVYVGEISLIR